MNTIARMRPPAEPGATGDSWVERRADTHIGLKNVPLGHIVSKVPSVSAGHPPVPIPQPQQRTSRRRPLVYPALLSRVADAFRQHIVLNDHTKDGLIYPDSFTGSEAVELISYIIKTTDRNLALLLGRALDAQGFLHDVVHQHRLRDSVTEIYRLPAPHPIRSETQREDIDRKVGEFTRVEADAVPPPLGVFTLLTDCYSPTCRKDGACYCCSCPKRVEAIRQQYRRLIVRNPSPSPTSAHFLNETAIIDEGASKEGLHRSGLKEPGKLWVQSVPKEIVASVSNQERKRQEAINEIVCAEYTMAQDLKYLQDCWIETLRVGDIIPPDRRDTFVRDVFWNIEEVLNVNKRLSDLLTKRQNAYPIVETIGDIFLEIVPHFQPVVYYGKHQLYGKHRFEEEKATNPAFAAFVEMVERLPESRKLGLDVYLAKPVTSLARYPLLLEAVLKHTPENNPDQAAIPKVIKLVRELLAKVNEEHGRTDNMANLRQLEKGLVFRPGEQVDLKLKDQERQLVHHGSLEYRGGIAGLNRNIQIFLLDHVLLIVRSKTVKKHERLEVFKRPIPLELLNAFVPDEDTENGSKKRTWFFRRSSDGHTSNEISPPASPTQSSSRRDGRQLKIQCLGRNGYLLTFWAPTATARDKWLEKITTQQEVIRKRSTIFNTHTLNEGLFTHETKLNCAVPYSRGMAYGTNNGIFFQLLYSNRIEQPQKRLNVRDVRQIEILEDYQLLITLSGKDILTLPFDATAMEIEDPTKYPKRMTSHISFFKIGHCLGRVLICAVITDPSRSRIQVFEPTEQAIRRRNNPTNEKILQEGDDTFELFKAFSIPHEVHSINFLKGKICVGGMTGFEIVDLESLDTQALLNPADITLDFVQQLGDLRAVSVYQIDGNFLLCYTNLAFYANKGGWWSKKNVIIRWEGAPTSFALYHPYIMAFDLAFIEIWHVETGKLAQVVRANNLHLLFAPTQLLTKNPTSLAGEIAYARDEVILASGDKVMVVKPAPPLPRTSDESVTPQT